MCIVLFSRPIISFNQTTDIVSRYPSYKRSAKVNLLSPEKPNLVSRGLGGRIGVRYLHLVLYHFGKPHSSSGEVVFFLRVLDHFQRPNITQELSQSCSMSYNW